MIHLVSAPFRRALAAGVLCLAAAALGACSSDEAAGGSPAAAEPTGDGPVYARGGFDDAPAPAAAREEAPAEAGSSGPAIEVTWEALAHERYLLENSRFRRRGPQPPQKIVLLSESHPRAGSVARGRPGEDGAHSTVVSDQHMIGLVQGLRDRGFFQHARPAGYDAAAASNSNARGRVTVVQNGQARSLISMRGQGTRAATRDIPRIYSEAKQAIMVLRNMNPNLTVTHQGTVGTASTR